MELSGEKRVEYFSAEPSSLKETRLHWNSCPTCRATFPEAVEVMESLKHEIERWAITALSKICQEHLKEENASRSAMTDPREFYADKLASLVVHGDKIHESDVQWALCYAFEGLPDFTVRCDSPSESSQRIPLTQCAEYILSLEPRAQSFVFASVLCHEMYYQLYRRAYRKTQDKLIRVEPQTGRLNPIDNDEYEHPYDCDFIHTSIKNAILNSEVSPEIAYDSILAAASEYLRRFRESIDRTPSGREPSSIEVRELKSDIADSLDSLKAGQDELLRLIERNSRPASAFEPDIQLLLGDVYGRLEQKTQRLLQVAEYLYDINKSEPNYFHGPVMMMAAAYENELNVRIVGRYVVHLLKEGATTYCVESSTQPLIDRGSPRNLTLGNMLWHLKNDRRLREWAQKVGFSSLDLISDDAGWLTGIRNRAAHQPIVKRSVADEVRHGMLQNDGMLARLFAFDAEP